MRVIASAVFATGAITVAVPAARAQQAAPKDPEPLALGSVAPDFTLAGATRYGVLARPIRLSDVRGKTVVLAFLYKAAERSKCTRTVISTRSSSRAARTWF